MAGPVLQPLALCLSVHCLVVNEQGAEMGREGKVRLEEGLTRSSSPFLSEHGRNRD